MPQNQLVILGSGFAACRVLSDIDLKRYRVNVISPRNHFLFTPLLTSTTVGTIEFRSIIEPIRLLRRDITFCQAACTAIDPLRRRITCSGQKDTAHFQLSYDTLVIAVGADVNSFGIPGVDQHCHFLKELSDARSIRQQVIDNLEGASNPGLGAEQRSQLLHFVVVGGGPTGIEFAAELHDLLDEDVRRLFPALHGLVRITVLEATETILRGFDERLAQYTFGVFKRQNIDIRTQSLVKEVRSGEVVLKDGSAIQAGLIVWSTGVGPRRLLLSSKFRLSAAKRLLTDDFLRLVDYPDIFALGDCAEIRGRPLPATAQVAEQQGKYLARLLNRTARGKEIKPYAHRPLGMLAYIGSSRALADLPGFKWSGFGAWLFWRSVYLTKLVSLKNRVLVLFDWAKTRLFGRDISRF